MAASGRKPHCAAITLPAEDRAGQGIFPTELRCGGVSFYWQAARPFSGPVTVTGIIRSDDYGFAPGSFPPAHGIVTSLTEASLLYVIESPGSRSWIPAPEPKQQFRPLGSYVERLGLKERHDSPQMLVTGMVIELETVSSPAAAEQLDITGDADQVVRMRIYPDYAGTVLWFHEPIPYANSGLSAGLVARMKDWEESYYLSLTPDLAWKSPAVAAVRDGLHTKSAG